MESDVLTARDHLITQKEEHEHLRSVANIMAIYTCVYKL